MLYVIVMRSVLCVICMYYVLYIILCIMHYTLYIIYYTSYIILYTHTHTNRLRKKSSVLKLDAVQYIQTESSKLSCLQPGGANDPGAGWPVKLYT